MLGMEGKAADGVDGRLTEDDGLARSGGNGEEAQVLPGPGGHTPPGTTICAAEFSADRVIFLSQKKEDGIGSVIGVEAAVFDERVDDGGRKATLMKQIMSDAAELARIWRRQFQADLGQDRIGLG
jgi:hypothetical protein